MNVKQTLVKYGSKVTSVFGKAGLKVRKYSPEILVVTGTVSVVAGVVLACKATLKAEEVLDKHDEEMEMIKEASNNEEEYSETDRKKDTVIVYAHTVGRFIKIYAPGAGFTLLGIGCFLSAYGILKKRNIALMAAYKTLETAFADYRKRVINDEGVEKDQYYMHGIERATLTETNEDGSDGIACEGIVLPGGRTPSMYARFFDETSTQWTRSAETNKMNLHAWQNWANDLLNARGYVFLNEVYQMLGIGISKAGQAVGWVKNNPNGGDNYIDFGMFNVYINRSDEPMRRFHNGYERSILLDFNVDGVIWDLI